MKKTTLVTIGTVVAGTVGAMAYVSDARNKKLKEMGYTYNKDTKQWEIRHEGNIWENMTFSTSHMLDQYCLDITVQEAAQKALGTSGAIALVVGFVCGTINRRNQK
jgi:hypothetical protein